jgi:hypothetical protein
MPVINYNYDDFTKLGEQVHLFSSEEMQLAIKGKLLNLLKTCDTESINTVLCDDYAIKPIYKYEGNNYVKICICDNVNTRVSYHFYMLNECNYFCESYISGIEFVPLFIMLKQNEYDDTEYIVESDINDMYCFSFLDDEDVEHIQNVLSFV